MARLAKETGWGYTRILGELKKLGITLARSTVVAIMKAHGLDPGPKRVEGTWSEFVKRHAETLWATDFFKEGLDPRRIGRSLCAVLHPCWDEACSRRGYDHGSGRGVGRAAGTEHGDDLRRGTGGAHACDHGHGREVHGTVSGHV